MPVYEYVCGACEKGFERLVTIAERDGVRCPDCGSGQVRRALSVFAAREGRVGGLPEVGGGGGCGRCGDPAGPCGAG